MKDRSDTAQLVETVTEIKQLMNPQKNTYQKKVKLLYVTNDAKSAESF